MIDHGPQADRLLVAEIWGEARHRACWRELSIEEEGAAVAELRELAGGRADLLAEVAGVLEGAREGELDEPLVRQRPCCAARPGPIRMRSRRGSRKAAAGRRTRGSRRSRVACTTGERGPSGC